jgi:mannose/fructose/N-acetylgalactosamine-specific phosphotransferase system component IIC
MFNNLSGKNRKKMLLNAFVYYPLAFLVGFSVAIAAINHVSKGDPPLGFIIAFAIFGILMAIKQLSQIYKDLLKKEHKKDM